MSAYVIPVLVLALFVFSFVAVLMVSVGSADDSAFDEQEPPKDRSLYLVQAHGAMLDEAQLHYPYVKVFRGQDAWNEAMNIRQQNKVHRMAGAMNAGRDAALKRLRVIDGAQTESR